MALVDLHVHSKHSDHPSEWFLQRLGAAESYTEPETVFRAAKARGMDLVAITDHNRITGALALKRMHPDKVIVGVEATTYFPADGCKVHVLIYGLDETQFEVVQMLRGDVFELREYVRREGLAHAVAHPTYSVNDRLTVDHLEQLICLFDVFEVINGSRDERSNRTIAQVLHRLDRQSFEALSRKHGIEPLGEESWLKGTTGGSDDHAGLLVGRTFTSADAATPEAFVEAIRTKRTKAGGRHNDHRTLAFAIYKIACDFSAAKGARLAGPLVEQVNAAVFEEPGRVGSGLLLAQKRALSRLRGNRIAEVYLTALQRLRSMRHLRVEERLDVVFDAICDASDEVVRSLASTISEEIKGNDMGAVVARISAAIPAAFLAVPFFSTMSHLNRSAGLLGQIAERFGLAEEKLPPRVLWFSDTVDDLNGVSVTLGNIVREAGRRGVDLKLVTSRDVVEPRITAQRVELPSVARFELPYYEQYRLEIPAIMRSIEYLHKLAPTRIYLSTPGPVGILGLLASKLLGIPCTAVYHTDFARQAERITDDSSASGLVEPYTRWFYSLADEIAVPTEAYIQLLSERGFDPRRMRVFRRGLDTALWSPRADAKRYLAERWGVGAGPVLLYTGRISKDKGLEMLIAVYRRVRETHPAAWLVVAGDGPHAAEMKRACSGDERVVFTGRLEQEELVSVVSGADVLVFPSTTDTFGMSVLEAQACGVPAVVSDVGGPQEIVLDGETGRVVQAGDLEGWVHATERIVAMAVSDPQRYRAMSCAARESVLERFGWDAVFQEILGESARPKDPEGPVGQVYSMVPPAMVPPAGFESATPGSGDAPRARKPAEAEGVLREWCLR